MSNVQFVFPKTKLAAQLRAAGGLPVAEALEAAQANLAELRPQGLSGLEALTKEALACFQRFPAEFSPEHLKELYAIASRGIGAGSVCGAAAADTTLISLCNLLDYLSAGKSWDRDAVAVHVRTLQLLVHGAGQGMDEAAASEILSGLKKVSARYSHIQSGPVLGNDLESG